MGVRQEGDKECGICYKSILSQGRKFGIMASCNHTFCLDCIKTFRTNNNKDK